MRTPRSVLLARAGVMRAGPSNTEALLWEQLRGTRLGAAFRRQVVIGRYIADFCAPRERLIVEVDGAYHMDRAQADARRDRDLGRLGYRVLRLPAAMVQHRIGEAVAVVRIALVAP